MSGAGRCQSIALACCAVAGLIAVGCWWPLPMLGAEEPPPVKGEDQPPEQTPRIDAAPADDKAAQPKNNFPNLLKRWFFGGSDDEAAEQRKRKRIDPRAPFNQKLSALLKKAQTQVKAGESRQALETLQRLLEMPEDALCEASPGKLISVRSAAHRLLAKLPGAELERYRSQYGALAKRELAAAIASGSPGALAQVATRYFQTESGFQAANLLASRYLDRGEYGLAAFWLRELLESHAPLTADPVWRTKAEYVADKIESPALKKLLDKQAPAAGEKVVLGGLPVDRALWLKSVARHAAAQTPTLQDWPQFFGSARRAGQAAAGEPLLLPRWSHPMTLSLAIRERVKELISDLRDDDQTPIFTFNPLLVDGKVIFRSLRGVKVVSADTGKLLWETSDEPAVEDVLAAISARDAGNGQLEQLNLPFGQALAAMEQQDLDEAPVSDHPLTHLLFRNANHGLLSSDGKRLFVIEDLSVMTNLQPGQYWGEDLPESDSLGRPLGINRLTAYDLQTGRSTWEVGGPSLNDPFELPLAGTFFFGAPVVDGRDLFVVAEKDGQIRLQALDAATGKPRWSQLIAHSQAKISMDVGRQWLSAPVAVGDGVIVCPTTVGWIVAIDRSTHGILWAYRYQDLNSQSDSEPQDEALQPAELNERWAAAPPVIVGDRVLFTPPEESRLICLSLSDGQLMWSEERDSALFLAGVFGDEALVVHDQSIRSINIKQPKQQQRTLQFKTEDARPAGRGVAVQDRYYLPLTSGELLAINLKTMQLEETAYLPSSADPEMTQFGNLAMYRGMLVSLSPQGLVAYEPKLSIEAELQQQLTANPQSAPAAVRKAELELLHRHYPAAREVLQKVHGDELAGELRQRYRAAVVTTLSALVREDLAARDAEFDELARLADQPTELQAVEMLRAERLISRRDFAGAFRVYSQFAETHGQDLVVPQEAAPWKVKGERWAAGKIEELRKLAPADVQTALDQLIQNAGTVALAQDREHQQRFIDLFGRHPATAEIRKNLTRMLSAAGEWQAAENLLVDLQAAPQHRIWATERLAGLWQQAGFSADAAHFYQILERDHAAATWDDSHTVTQHLQEMRAAGGLPEAQTKPICDWHNRELTATRAGSNFDGGGIHKDINQQGSGLPFFRQHRLQFVSQEPRFEIVDARSEKKVWSLPIRTAPESAQSLAHVTVSGHQVVLYQGNSITALSPTERRVLWSHVVDDHFDFSGEDLEDALGSSRAPYPMRSLERSAAQFSDKAALGDYWALFSTEGTTRVANQHYVCYLVRRRLVVLDARTGKAAWTRAGLPLGTQLVGGPNAIYAWNAAQDAVTAYAAVDGRELAIPDLSTLCKKAIGRVGDDFVRTENIPGSDSSKSESLKLERVDPLQQTVRWSLTLPRKTLASSLSGNRLVLADPQGQLQMCDLETGAVRPCGQVPTSALRSNTRIYTIPTYDQLLVVTHRDDRFPNDRSIDTFPAIRVNGIISSFDLTTGNEQWKQSVSGLHLVLEQLDHSPIVLCLARVFEPSGEGTSVKWLVLAIDRQHGQIVHQSESQVQASFHQMSVNMLDEAVELKTYNDRLRLVPKSK